ncbi:MAG: DnaJ domain-containing protein [Dehalococcoidales bacterium]|nr:DnaJ domain-containing protein [Dehalococcoidales bacterium]
MTEEYAEEYTEKDYYAILGISPNAGLAEIRFAYRRLALEYHPDRNQDDPAATEKMREINEAYAVLSNPEKRQEYDELREQDDQSASERFKQTHTTEDIYRGSDVNQVYSDLAKKFGLRDFDKVFREAYGPGYRSFEFQNKGVYGRAFVFFGPPKGSRGASRRYSPQTDAELTKLVQQMARNGETAKKGKDRKNTITLSPQLARRGGEAELSIKRQGTIRKIKIKIPAGMQEGQQIRLRGMGDAGKGGAEPGDLYLEVRLKI